MKKILKIFMVIMISFLILNINAKAVKVSFEQENDEKYLKLCQYDVVRQAEGHEEKETNYIGIFYNMDDDEYEFVIKNYVSYSGANRTPHYDTSLSVTKTSGKIYNNEKGVYFQNSKAAGEFQCPTNGYIDFSSYALNEMCFDDDGKWCANYADDWTTRFGKTSNEFVSQKLTYNIEDHVKTYIVGNDANPDGWLFNDISCDDVNSGKFNLKTDLKDKVISDFSKNFLKSRPAPTFIINFDVYKKLNTINSSDGGIDKDISEKINNFKNKCISEIEAKVKSGKLTAEEAKKYKNKYNVSESEIASQLNSATTQIETGTGDYAIPTYEIKENTYNCKEFIGENLYKLVHLIISALRIIGAIIAIVNGMISLIPALISKDADALKKAQTKCVTMAIVLVLIILLPTLLTFIGNLFGYDLSCIA